MYTNYICNETKRNTSSIFSQKKKRLKTLQLIFSDIESVSLVATCIYLVFWDVQSIGVESHTRRHMSWIYFTLNAILHSKINLAESFKIIYVKTAKDAPKHWIKWYSREMRKVYISYNKVIDIPAPRGLRRTKSTGISKTQKIFMNLKKTHWATISKVFLCGHFEFFLEFKKYDLSWYFVLRHTLASCTTLKLFSANKEPCLLLASLYTDLIKKWNWLFPIRDTLVKGSFYHRNPLNTFRLL